MMLEQVGKVVEWYESWSSYEWGVWCRSGYKDEAARARSLGLREKAMGVASWIREYSKKHPQKSRRASYEGNYKALLFQNETCDCGCNPRGCPCGVEVQL